MPCLQQLLFILLTFTTLISSSISQGEYCSPSEFNCGSIRSISYPFSIDKRPKNCSYPQNFLLTCDDDTPEIEIRSKKYVVRSISYETQHMTIADPELIGKECPPTGNYSAALETPLFAYTTSMVDLTIFHNCSDPPDPAQQDPYLNPSPPPPPPNPLLYPVTCSTQGNKKAYYSMVAVPPPVSSTMGTCEVSVLSIPQSTANQLLDGLSNFKMAMENGFEAKWLVDDGRCPRCTSSGGSCGYNAKKPNEPLCYCEDNVSSLICPAKTPDSSTKNVPAPSSGRRKDTIIRKTAIGISAAIGGCLFTGIVVYFCYHKKRPIGSSTSKLISRTISSDPSSNSELGSCYSLLPTHIFSYEELEEATNNFDQSKELGKGGFGTVYHGKLYDGRCVAVKRLYENNYRHAEQFKNEIEILSRLRHQNLVALYGCTSRHSRELLLVYEFVPNGTVADHLHGNRAKAASLTWPIRMSIAIETADALSYLHAVEIVHRDVKTNNVLLDNNFGVKVADFGLSRLFPFDKTHVSTAPQGTPGYVDPDYHRCYQLTDKSDVFSFGVVLFELISSKPAVDITRRRNEINLSSMAINKIHNNALHELVDPSLKFESDNTVKRMITSVAELAYRCLHDEKDMRPSMKEVLKVLREIDDNKYKAKKPGDIDFKPDDVILSKNLSPPSPDSVTLPWISRTSTPNVSG